MEFHQIRYFLALASTLNFTRAAEMCNVSQPALTRAIQQLEYELGGPLLIRERRYSHLSELGQRMLPILQDCFKRAQAAKALALMCREEKQPTLKLAMVGSVDLDRIVVPLGELISQFPEVEISVVRGSNEEILEYLKSGEATFAISDSELGSWERLDSWTLDRVPYALVANRLHPFALRQPVDRHAIAGQRLVCLPYCSLARDLLERSAEEGIVGPGICQVDTLPDIFTLLKLNIGVALLPQAVMLPDGIVQVATKDVDLEHTAKLYAVAGRRRSNTANAFIAHFRRSNSVQDLEPEQEQLAVEDNFRPLAAAGSR